jgi:hypothetical protein
LIKKRYLGTSISLTQMSFLNTSIQAAHFLTGQSRQMKGGAKQQSLPAHQMLSAKHAGKIFLPTKRILASTYPSSIFQSAGKATSLIPSIDYIEEINMQIQITVSGNSVVLTPCSYWFRQIDLRDSSSGQIIQTHYDDTATANLLNRVTYGRERAIFKTNNIESDRHGKYGLTQALPVGTHTFYVPLMTSVFENFGGLYLADLVGDLALDLTTPSTIIASGSGTISSNISFLVSGYKLNDDDIAIHRNRYKMHAAECHFLEPVRTEFYNTTLTAASSNNLLKLNNVDGLVAYQMVLFRPTGTIGVNTNFASWRMLNIGDSNGAGLDLVSSSGESIYGMGSHVPTRYLRQHMSVDNFDNSWVSEKPVYFLSYCANMNQALRGVVNGGRRFRSTDGDAIRVNLPSAPVNELQSITFSTAPAASGYYAFTFRGEQSAVLIANSTPFQMKTAIENMRTVSSKFMTVTCSAAASAGAVFSITITDPEGTLDNGDLFRVVCFDGITATPGTTRMVAAVPGLATGAYDIQIYSYLYNLAGYSNGRLTSQLLLV